VVLRHQGKRQIDSRGDPGRGNQPSVADVDTVELYLCPRELRGEAGGVLLVRRHNMIVKQAGMSERKGARTD
jgi:hypothetical protein